MFQTAPNRKITNPVGVCCLLLPRVLAKEPCTEDQCTEVFRREKTLRNLKELELDCTGSELADLKPAAMLATIFSTQCLPGDLAMALLTLQDCILAQEWTKALVLHQSLLQLAFFAADCLDEGYWGFSVRDVAVEQARMIWEMAQRSLRKSFSLLSRLLPARLAWSPWRGLESEVGKQQQQQERQQQQQQQLQQQQQQQQLGWRPGQAWHQQCGPHLVSGPVGIAKSQGATGPPLGPLCTESGRFWLTLDLDHKPWSWRPRALAIIAVTFAWTSNPWHHLHWWLPALLQLKGMLQLGSDALDVALVFPHEAAAWETSSSTYVDPQSPQRSEPERWSILQHGWPLRADVSPEESSRPWQPQGIHADVLRWLSDRPAAPLADFQGANYEQLVLGLPSLRFVTQTPQVTCSQLAAVRRWVGSRAEVGAAAATDVSSATRSRPPWRVSVLQRSAGEGRLLRNFEEVLASLRGKRFEDLLQVTTIQDLAHGLPWAAQFRLFTRTDILIGAHGAGLSWLWAQPPGSAVLEFRPRGDPHFWLRCSEAWDTDLAEMFGGLARLAGIHHICIRPHGAPHPGLQEAVSFFDRNEDVYIHLPILELLVHEAMGLLSGGPLPCH
ncbi:unnamed protein product [Polarella glacialis]|uniref:Glycosyltransferase 61 catalytic domain-containing protein n=1 Tax=Polarella glacialis TaxID=89957 RepID=A0A813JW13_POLGL|nr:unnamed protein product [Polarella glacialis]